MKRMHHHIVSFLIVLTVSGNAFHSLAQAPFPGAVIAQSPDPIQFYHASPSITIMPDGVYVASHDWGGPGTAGIYTSVYRSADKGVSWQLASNVKDIRWANLFFHRGALYLMGTKSGMNNVVIRKSTDGGINWTNANDQNTGLLIEGRFHTAPVTMVVHNGRIWRAFEESPDPANERQFEAFVLSAPVDADLLKASSWTRTNGVPFDPSWFNADKPEWCEGNAVLTKEGKMIDFIRVGSNQGVDDSYDLTGYGAGIPRYEIAARINISDDGKTASFDPSDGFVHFPGAIVKFTIRYDEESDKYWSIVNKITHSVKKGGAGSENGAFSQRNVLMLMSSDDLSQWEERYKVISWNQQDTMTRRVTFGFQYTDWQFEGNDIVAVARTSWYGHDWHNANVLTFHRLENFRSLTMADSPEDLGSATASPADVLSWQFSQPETAGGEATYTSTFTHNYLDASVLTRGEGLKPYSFARSFSGTPEGTNKSRDNAINNNHYYEFKVHPKKGYRVSIGNLDARLGRNTSGCKSYIWTYSLDGSTFYDIGSGGVFGQITDPNGSQQATVRTFGYKDLQKITDPDTVTFRLYVWNSSAGGYVSIGRFAADNTTPSLKVGGIVEAVPEAPTPLLAWNFNKTSGSVSGVSASTQNEWLKESVLYRGSGFTPAGLTHSFNSNMKIGGNKEDALDDNACYIFDVQVKSGHNLSLSGLQYKVRRNTTGANAFRWYYQLNGGELVALGNSDIPFLYKTNSGVEQPAIDLSGVAALQNLSSTDKVSFRLYGWGATDSNGGFALGVYEGKDCLSITGEVMRETAINQTTGTEDIFSVVRENDSIQVNISQTMPQNAVISILDATGHILERKHVTLETGFNTFDFPLSLPKGVYIAALESNQKSVTSKKFIIN